MRPQTPGSCRQVNHTALVSPVYGMPTGEAVPHGFAIAIFFFPCSWERRGYDGIRSLFS